MTFNQLTNLFNFHNIGPLIEEYFPDHKRHLYLYLRIFSQIDEMSLEDISTEGCMIKIKETMDSRGVKIIQSLIFDKNGWVRKSPNLNILMGAEINYATMEMYSDEEIFIRSLNNLVIYQFADEIKNDFLKSPTVTPDIEKYKDDPPLV